MTPNPPHKMKKKLEREIPSVSWRNVQNEIEYEFHLFLRVS